MTSGTSATGPMFTERDLDFVIDAVEPASTQKARLKRMLIEDPAFRVAMVGDERVFQRLAAEEHGFLRISPVLYFEILLRRTARELQSATHTVEREGSLVIPVFDADRTGNLLTRDGILEYLAGMLASFTRIHSHVSRVRTRRRVWRKVRFSDIDIDSLTRLCAGTDEEQRFPIYKRIGDVCLFIPSVFSSCVQADTTYSFSGRRRPPVSVRQRRTREDYRQEGKRAYRLAAEHPGARAAGLSGVLTMLQQEFDLAHKPLAFMSERYLGFARQQLFGTPFD